MWQILRSTHRAKSTFAATAAELLQSSTRTIILSVGALWLVWHVLMTTLWPTEFMTAAWAVSVVVLASSAGALFLLPKRALGAEVVWLAGLFGAIAVAVRVFAQPEIAYAFVFLPLLAVVMVGWVGGIVAEAAVVMVVAGLSLGFLPTSLRPAEAVAISLGGCVAGLLGWSATRTLHIAVRWAFAAFDDAEQHKEAAQEHRAQLAKMVGDLDQAYYRIERSNAALVAARLAAEEAERFKAEFVTNVSHELRTPLNLILGFSEVMLTSPESYDGAPMPPGYRSDLNAICHSAQHLLALVDDVLDMARIGAGRIPLVREQVDVGDLVGEATATVRDYIATKGLRLDIALPPDLPPLWLDRVRIRQVLLNLLVNAARFTERGSIQIHVHHDADEVVVAVRDTGRGITKADLPHIFEAFRTTEQPFSTWHSGTGLGLPISKQFVELHGGRIGVESVPGLTTFWFALPVAAMPVAAAPLRAGRWTPRVTLNTIERIVVVAHEDPRVVALVKRYVDGCSVVHAPTLDAALLVAQDTQAIAIIVDADKDVPPTCGSTTIIRCPFPSGRRIALALGADDFLVKPVGRTELLASVDRLGHPVRRVLVADDNPKVVRLFRRILQLHPSIETCVEAFNGEEALALMRAEPPDLLVLDLSMPVVDGVAVLEQMAADPTLRPIPVIVVSAKASGENTMRTGTTLALHQSAGFELGDAMRALNALVQTLSPAWHLLGSREPGSEAGLAA
jgi:signal transduction histidine kinase/CheY-like chemotaxis protein